MVEQTEQRVRRTGPNTAWSVVVLLLLFILVLLPFAVSSVFADISEQSAPIYVVIPPNPGDQQVHSDLHVQMVALNEWEGTASLRVSAHHTCDRACPWGDRYLFVSTFGDTAADETGRPSSEVVSLPATTRDAVQVIKLPIYGDPIRYPFDSYRLGMGIIVERVLSDGTVQTLSPAEARGYISLSLQARIPRAKMDRPVSLDPAGVQNDADIEQYATVELLTIERPVYLKVLTVLLVLLVTAAAAYAVFMRPLDQLIINSGALVLGVWGVRSILLGTAVPGFSAVDLALAVVILFLLVTITVRTLWLLEESTSLRLVRRIRPKKAEPPPLPPPPLTPTPDYVPGGEPNGVPADAVVVQRVER